MPATDPLSLVFLGCVIFSGGFLVISTLLGLGHTDGGLHIGHGHGLHLGHDLGGHDAGHAGHAIHTDTIHGHSQISDGSSHGHVVHADTGLQSSPSPWTTLTAAFWGALTLYGLLMFLLVFGLVGYVLHNALGLGLLALTVAILLGVGSSIGLTTLLSRVFSPGEETILTAESSQLEGRVGQVTMSIRPGGIGEVIFTRKGGGRQSIGARSADDEAIPREADVVILGYRGGIATVQAWDRFISNVRAGTMPLLEPLEP
ncbi:MAG TPA: NfeD family protein [Ktedonobacterales bacterium]|jgi:membrane protein implicated in regulation of membrane protease activity|nr:NfeD family protein [Ktedonobacterales bacterium]